MSIPDTRLSHQDRVDAVVEHGRFFSSIASDDLGVRVPACPDWTVEDAVRHVAGGAAGARGWCELSDSEIASPIEVVREQMALAARLPFAELSSSIDSYLKCLGGRSPDSAAYLHSGLDTIERQVWHMSGDWGVHRHDVEVALGAKPTLFPERAADLIVWFTDYLVPLVEELRDLEPRPTIRFIADDAGFDYQHGNGEPEMTVSGSARDVLLYLWRRPHGPVTVEGDPVAAQAYRPRNLTIQPQPSKQLERPSHPFNPDQTIWASNNPSDALDHLLKSARA